MAETDLNWLKLFHKIDQIQSRQKSIEKRLDSLENNLWKLEEFSISLKFLPDMVLEKLYPLLIKTQVTNSVSYPQAEKHQPQRKDSWTWKEHILFTLHFEDRPLRSSELVDIHLALKVKGKEEKRFVQKDIGKNLTALVKGGRVIKYKPPGASKFVYCLPHWIDANGDLNGQFIGRTHYI